MRTRPSILLVLLAFVALGATCKGNNNTTPAARPDIVPSEAPAKQAVVAELEGVDLSRVRPEQRADAVRLFNENSCYCGCTRTLAGCLAARADCPCVKCSDRMASFILGGYEAGLTTPEIEATLLDGFSEGYNAAPKTFDVTDQPMKGAPTAKHTLVEFADFRCGHCRAAFGPLTELVAKNPDVRLVYYYYPLGQGSDTPSMLAAEAAEEARVQGKFWEFAKVLFENQHATEAENLIAYGAMVGLDLGKLKTALDTRVHKERVLADKKLGQQAQVESTPTIFVDGRPFGLGHTIENLELRLQMESERGRCE